MHVITEVLQAGGGVRLGVMRYESGLPVFMLDCPKPPPFAKASKKGAAFMPIDATSLSNHRFGMIHHHHHHHHHAAFSTRHSLHVGETVSVV